MADAPRTPNAVGRQRRRLRHLRLVALGYSGYAQYLTSSHWLNVRAAYRASDRPQVCMCGESEGLQLHHKTYDRIGAEHLNDLELLCAGCHNALHVLERRGDVTLDTAGLVSPQRAAEYAVEQDARRHVADQDFAVTRPRAVAEALPLGPRLRRALTLARARGVDTDRYVGAITHRVEALERRTARALAAQ